MITRSQMRRQLRAKGGIMNISSGTIGGGGYTGIPMGSRTGFGIIDKLKDRVRKLIPNELASVAVKAAPFVAPFNPAIAGLMRGIGRFDQRGSLSDAVKQGALTYGFGKGVGKLGGASGSELGNVFGRQQYSMEGFKDRGLGRLFQGKQPVDDPTKKLPQINKDLEKVATKPREGLNVVKEGVDFVKEKIPMLENLPDDVAQKLLVGGITGGASALYSYFTGEFEPQQPGESMEEYMARRNTRVKQQMRGYMDSYYTPLRNPQYAAMSDEEKNNYIDSIVGQGMATGGRVGYQTGGISMTNTAAQNRAINNAQRASNIASRQNALERFRDHAITSNIMKGVTGKNTIPEYGLQTGADFQMKFPGVNPKVSAGLAAAYQTLQEGSRAILDGPGGVTLKDAYNTAVDQTGKNIEGILAADTGTLTAEQLKNRNEYLPIDQQTTTPTPDAGLSQAGVIPGFTKLKNPNGAPGNYNEFMYKGPDGQIYGSETYSSIAAGQYPDIYDPNKATLAGGGMPMGEPRVNQGGVTELDYRAKGGFVPVGIKEKADDVPAMLSKNEFVFTADAVRGAGNGSVEKGAQKMYDTMKNLERRVT